MSRLDNFKTMDEWKAIAEYHKKQLEIAEQKVQELSAQPDLISKAEFTKRVTEMMTGNKRRLWSWKKAIEIGLVENVREILADCYDNYIDPTENEEFAAKAKEVLGPFGSRKWQLFMLKVFEDLVKNDCFIQEDGTIDTFEDTAGGCDEITWDVGYNIIKETNLQGTVLAYPTV